MNVIDSNRSERDKQIGFRDLRELDCAGKLVPAFVHPALADAPRSDARGRSSAIRCTAIRAQQCGRESFSGGVEFTSPELFHVMRGTEDGGVLRASSGRSAILARLRRGCFHVSLKLPIWNPVRDKDWDGPDERCKARGLRKVGLR